MEWLKNLLEGKGVSITDEILADVQKEIPKYFMPKSEYNLKLDEIKCLKEQISTRDNDLAELQKNAQDNEALKKQYEDLQKKYDDDTKALQDNITKTQFDSALDIAVTKSGTKNSKAHLDT